ncbi:ARM repeat-containing protein [Suillus brevipes Sb2]|nr:ARM repeat-containing protein [Suillus brevipes Sb2]
MRKRVSQKSGDLWMQLPQDVRLQIKEQLPILILAEQDKLVRHSAARVIAAAASIELTAGTWPQLLPWLHQSCTSPQVAHREVAVFILFTVLDSILFKLFEGLLRDPESIEVRITTVRALGVIAQYIDSDDKADIQSFQGLLPDMIRILGQSIESGDEAGVRQLFDVFETLLILVRFHFSFC